MKILLVWANHDQWGYKPIALSLISAILKKLGHTVELFDTTYINFNYADNSSERTRIKVFKPVDLSSYNITKQNLSLESEIISKLESFYPDVIMFSVLSDELPIALEIARIVKSYYPNLPILFGNKSATVETDKILNSNYVDYCCIGEGIEFISNFLNNLDNPSHIPNIAYLKGNKIIKNPLRPYFNDLDSLPYLDWYLFDSRHFIKPFDGKALRGGDILTSWGCPNQCTYCLNSYYKELYGKNIIRRYSVSRAIDEIKYLVSKYNLELLIFHDEDFLFKPSSYFNEFASRYTEEINLPFSIMTNARTVTEERVKTLKSMSCASVSIGIETGNVLLRRHYLNRNETPAHIINAFSLFNKYHIRNSSFNMLGLPFETRDTIFETINLNRNASVQYPNSNFFYPFEGTKLREISIRHNFFDPNIPSVYQQDKPFLHFSNLSEQELIALRNRFVLYIKFPLSLYPYIERSEQPDRIGKTLTEKLFSIYDETVFSNPYNIYHSHKNYIPELEEIINK